MLTRIFDFFSSSQRRCDAMSVTYIKLHIDIKKLCVCVSVFMMSIGQVKNQWVARDRATNIKFMRKCACMRLKVIIFIFPQNM